MMAAVVVGNMSSVVVASILNTIGEKTCPFGKWQSAENKCSGAACGMRSGKIGMKKISGLQFKTLSGYDFRRRIHAVGRDGE